MLSRFLFLAAPLGCLTHLSRSLLDKPSPATYLGIRMNEAAFARLRKQLKEERDRDLDLIEQAYQTKLKALGLLKDLPFDTHGSGAPSSDATVPPFSASSPRRSRTSDLKNTIALLIPQMKPEFTVREIVGLLRELYPGIEAKASPASISNALIRLAEDGTYGFSLKERGKGKRASIYRRTEVAR